MQSKTYGTLEAMDLLRPYDGELEYYPVSKEVNYPANNKADVIKPLS